MWLSSRARLILRDERLPMPQLLLKHKRARLIYQPLGVVGVISPWNFPFSIPFTQAAAAVAAGNGVVVKPAEWAPLSGAWLERLFEEAGFPVGLVRVVHGEGSAAGAELVRAPGVAKLIFTGSATTGREVATAAAELLRPVTLELGGKDPMLVFGDCDLERAVSGARWAAFTNCGQVCSGVERIYVAQPLFERFVSELGRTCQRAADRSRPGAVDQLGPMIRERQRTRVTELVDDALEHGAEVVCGGMQPKIPLPGWFYEPTVLAGVRIGGRIADEEVFGPGGDGGAVRERGRGRSARQRLPLRAAAQASGRATPREHAGLPGDCRPDPCATNDAAYSYYAAQATWGGCKESGFGRTHGKHGLYDLSHVKFVDTDSGRVRVPWWFPYWTLCPRGLSRRAGRALREGRPASVGARLGCQARSGAHGEAVPGPGMSGELSHVDEEGRRAWSTWVASLSCAAVRRLGPSFVCPLAPPSVCMSCRRAMRSRRPSWPA